MPAANNPYIINGPILDDAVFFGRRHLTEAISDVLRYPAHTSVIVFGQRKMGKSSLLRHLERAMQPPFFPVYYDLAGKAMDSVGQVLYEMAVAAARNAHIPPPDAADFQDNPDAFHTRFLPALYQALGHQLQPTFLLDEFDAIDIPESELPENAAVRNLDTYLYRLLTTQTHTDFIFAAGRRMNELSNVQTSGYQANLTQHLAMLSPEHTRSLILQPGAPAYHDDAIAYILEATRGHPYLTQLLCHTLFEQTQPRPDQPIAVKDVKAAQAALISATDNDIAKIWDSMPDAEQLTLAAAAATAATHHAVVPPAALEHTLTQADVPITLPQIRRAPRNLVNWQMLEQSGGGYIFYTDFLRRWVAANRPLNQIKEAELATLSPKADQLYQLALLSHRRGDPGGALAKLNEALAANPNHLAALTLKGEILTAQNRPAEAVEAYDKAYSLNPLLTAGALAAALTLLGQQQEQAGNPAAALESYRRARRIDPHNEAAGEGETRVETQLAPPAQADAVSPEPAPQPAQTPKSQRNWWPLAIAALLLLLLCGWLYSSGMLGRPAATPDTSVARTGGNTTPTGQAQTGLDATGNSGGNAESGTTATTNSDTETGGDETTETDTDTSPSGADTGASDAGSSAETGTSPSSGADAGANGADSGGEASTGTDATGSSGDSAGDSTATGGDTAGNDSAGSADGSDQRSAPLSGVINIGGSSAHGPLFQALAAQFSASNPNVQFNISGDSSSRVGLERVLAGESDIALLARDLSPEELAALNGAQLFTLPQQDDVTLAVNPLIPVDDLSPAQVRDIFAGTITNWQEVGGPDAPIVRVLPGADSDTRQVFQQQLMGDDATLSDDGAVIAASDGEVLSTVTTRPNAIGFAAATQPAAQVRLARIAQTESWPVIDTALLAAKPVTIDQAAPGSENYPMRRPINLVAAANLSPVTQAWIDFIYSPAGQRVIEQARRAEGSAQ